jgi:hypothetical protein
MYYFYKEDLTTIQFISIKQFQQAIDHLFIITEY